MNLFLVSLADPIVAVPALLIGLLTRGRVRLWLGGIFLAALALLTFGLTAPALAAEALFSRAVAAGLYGGIGSFIGSRWSRSKRAAQARDEAES